MYGYGYSPFVKSVTGEAGVIPLNTVAPAITGSVTVGSTLTSTTGTWAGTPVITYAYQWKRGASNIVGATNSAYILQAADVGQLIKCTVTATNAFGSVSADSNAITATWEADAQAFITAASITDPTQQSAINTLVVDLKGYGIWTKMKALYPFVGGTASSHKYNLKNPLDTDAAFRLVFSGGWTHNANGATPNGTNGYADTKLSPLSVLQQNNNSIGYYNRNSTALINTYNGVGNPNWFIIGTGDSTNRRIDYWANAASGLSSSNTNAILGMAIGTRTGSTTSTIYKNGVFNTSYAVNSQLLPSSTFYLGAINSGTGSTINYNNFNLAFFHISDGLSNTEAANFYTVVQAFQTTLGRSIGTQTVSDADAQAFVTAANIQDQVEANAVNNLVIGLKADGIWSKMKAIYPFVGGTASQHKWNLKDPRDLDAAYRLVFSGGIIHSNNGVDPNGTNAFGDTKLPVATLGNTSLSVWYYSRENLSDAMTYIGAVNKLMLQPKRNNGLGYYALNSDFQTYTAISNTSGFIGLNRTGASDCKVWKNGSSVQNVTITGATNDGTNLRLFSREFVGQYTAAECAFSAAGEGLTNTEAANLYTAVQTFQTTLNRQV